MASRPFRGPIYEGYGPRDAPLPGASTFHEGVDGGPPGNYAPEGGVIFAYGYAGSYGYLLQFAGWDTGWTHWMGHNRDPQPAHPVMVPAPEGTYLSEIGSTGNSTGTHNHWETHRPEDGAAVDPMQWLYRFAGAAGGGTSPFPDPEDEQEYDMDIVPITNADGSQKWYIVGRFGRVEIPEGHRGSLNAVASYLKDPPHNPDGSPINAGGADIDNWLEYSRRVNAPPAAAVDMAAVTAIVKAAVAAAFAGLQVDVDEASIAAKVDAALADNFAAIPKPPTTFVAKG